MTDVPVRVRDCTCPDTPHDDGDIVYLPSTLTLDSGLEAEGYLLTAADVHPAPPGLTERAEAGDSRAELELERVAAARLLWLRPRWFPLFVRQATGWNLLDAEGERVPFDVEVILADYAMARAVADAAADLYQPAILAPFMTPPPRRSDSGRTDGGTPPPTAPTPLRSRSSSRASSGGRRSAANR